MVIIQVILWNPSISNSGMSTSILIMKKRTPWKPKIWIIFTKKELHGSRFQHVQFKTGISPKPLLMFLQSLLLFLFWYPIMTALSTGHSSLGQYVRRCAILTFINSLSDVTTLAFMLVFMNTAPVPLLAVVYVGQMFIIYFSSQFFKPINLMVNCCCCIFSYRGGSSMIFPWGELCHGLSHF